MDHWSVSSGTSSPPGATLVRATALAQALELKKQTLTIGQFGTSRRPGPRDDTGAGAGAEEASMDHWSVLERVRGHETHLLQATALEHVLELRNTANRTPVGA